MSVSYWKDIKEVCTGEPAKQYCSGLGPAKGRVREVGGGGVETDLQGCVIVTVAH